MNFKQNFMNFTADLFDKVFAKGVYYREEREKTIQNHLKRSKRT